MTTTLPGVEYGTTSLTIKRPLTPAKYGELLAGLGAMATGHQWWIGDALVWGDENLDEHEFLQVVDVLGLEPATITNYRWVASKVDSSRRREELTWSHHAEVARLEPRSQARMLREAVERGWGIRELRDAVAIRYPQPGRDNVEPERPAELTPADEALINRRLEGLDVALENARAAGPKWHQHVTLEDVQWLYSLTRSLVRGRR